MKNQIFLTNDVSIINEHFDLYTRASKLELSTDDFIDRHKAKANEIDMSIANGKVNINLNGMVLGSVPWYYAWFGVEAISTKALLNTLETLLDSSEIDSINFNINTPGGHSVYLGEINNVIKEFNKRDIDTSACVPNLCASAGYWLISNVKNINVGQTGEVGSIGAYTIVYDVEKAYENNGIKFHVIRSNELKGIGAGDALTENQLNAIQKRVDNLTEMFKTTVSEGRKNIDIDKVATGEVFAGKYAIEAGLADNLLSDKYYARKEESMDLQAQANLLIQVAIAEGKKIPNNITELVDACVKVGSLEQLNNLLNPVKPNFTVDLPNVTMNSDRNPFNLSTDIMESFKNVIGLNMFEGDFNGNASVVRANDKNWLNVYRDNVAVKYNKDNIPSYYGNRCYRKD
ncbi:MAG: hypothetical protein HC877_20675 [Thioploca sp.]|nr:hypothetical protein [Thioploca sp.]